MKHGTLTTKGNRVELRFERRLAHPPEKVWRALTDSKELAHWFPARIEGAREAGAELRFFFEEGDPGTGKISVFDPPRVLEYTWEGDSASPRSTRSTPRASAWAASPPS